MATYTATLTYTSTKAGYESGSQTFTAEDANNVDAIKTFISTDIGSTNLLTASIIGEVRGVPSYLFDGCTNMTSCNLSGATVNSANLSYMFRNCSSLTSVQLFGSTGGNVNNISYLFYGCTSLPSIDLSAYTFTGSSSVSGSYVYGFAASYAFYNCQSLTNISIPTITLFGANSTYNYYRYSFSYMFSGCKELTSLTLNIVTNIMSGKYSSFYGSYMFSGCTKLANLNFTIASNGTNNQWLYIATIDGMFQNCKALTNIDLSTCRFCTGSYGTTSTATMSYMFSGCNNLQSVTFPSSFFSHKVTLINSMFNGCSKLTTINSANWSALTIVSNIGWLFGECTSLAQSTIQSIISAIPTSQVTNISGLFYNCSHLTTIDLSTFDTTKVTNMASLFSGCSGLTSVTFGANFTTKAVTNMQYMFSGCKNWDVTALIKTLDYTACKYLDYFCSGAKLSEFDFSALPYMDWSSINTNILQGGIFSGTQYMGTFTVKDTNDILSQLTNLTGTNNNFIGAAKANKIVLAINLPYATALNYLFYSLSNCTEIDCSNFYAPNVTTLRYALSWCTAFTQLDLTDLNIDLTKITSVSGLFYYSSNLTEIDLGNLDLSKITDIDYAFNGCTNLTKIYAQNSIDPNVLANYTNTFNNCSSALKGSNNTTWSSDKTSGLTYAKLDTNDSVGLLSSKNKYTITYDAGSGSISGGRTTYFSEDNNYTLPTPTPPAGYRFDGWKDSPSATSYVTVLPSGSSGNKSYTAYYSLVPIILNGTDQVTAIYLNGSPVTSLYLNGTQIF